MTTLDRDGHVLGARVIIGAKTSFCSKSADFFLLSEDVCEYPLDFNLFVRGYYINSDALGIIGGTANASADNYILDAFEAYDVSGITVEGRFNINYTNIEISLRNDRLLYLLLDDHDLYGNHHVICYAYTRLVSSTDGSYVTYLKVADGWASTPRYIDIASVNGDKYWEINY